jgi:sugar phosphate isomerase/epimerase
MTNIDRVTRREAMRLTAGGLLALGGAPALLAGTQAKKIPVAVQLYSVRDDCKKDFDGSMKQVAEMGFEAVEFAGYYKYGGDAESLRKKLDELKLKVAGTHIGAGSLTPGALKKTMEFHKTIGCRFLIVPGDGRFTNPEKSKEYAQLMTEAAATLKAEGMYCGHHNHTGEFKKDGDKTYWDLFAERTSKDVVLQQDVGWTTDAKLDPVEYIRKYPGRTKTTHFKPQGGKAIIGQDTVNWKGVIQACYEVGGTEFFIVEQEHYSEGRSPMECTKLSLQGLKKILAEMGK